MRRLVFFFILLVAFVDTPIFNKGINSLSNMKRQVLSMVNNGATQITSGLTNLGSGVGSSLTNFLK